jgi:cell division protein FtsB
LKRALAGLAAAALAAFAVFGGEYDTGDYLELRSRVRQERARIARLRLEVDSLARVQQLLETDSATQERAARELYGMIRDGEILYQVVPGDSVRR